MNLTDLFIIYFTGGAPFAVYYFLQNRRQESNLLPKTAIVFLLWIFFAVSLLLQSKIRRQVFDYSSENQRGQILSLHQKKLEEFLVESKFNISVFDLRETIERYVGLTLNIGNDIANGAEQEILRIAENDNLRLGSICIERRNRNRLARHQTEARKDFIRLVGKLSELTSDTDKFQQSVVEIVRVLKDEEAQSSLGKIFAENLSNGQITGVEHSEKDLWKPQEPKLLRVETISSRS